MYGPSLDPRERHREWTVQQDIDAAAQATRNAQRQAQADYEAELSGDTLPSVIDGGPVSSAIDPLSGMYTDPSVGAGLPDGGAGQLPTLEEAGGAGMDAMARDGASGYGGPSPFNAALMSGQSGRNALGSAYDLAGASAGGVRSVTTRDPYHPILKEHQAATRENSANMVEAVEESERVDLERGVRGIDFLNNEREYLAAQAQQREDAAIVESSRLSAQLGKQREVNGEIDAVTKKLRSAPMEDQGRFWKNKTGFQKFALTLSAMAKGWLQGQGYAIDPMANIREGIRADVESQRQERAQLGEQLSATERKAAHERNMFDQLYAKIGDERLTADALELAHFKEAQATLAQLQAEGDLAAMGPEYQKQMAGLMQEIADRELELKAKLAAHPEFRTKLVKSPNVWVTHPQTGKPVLVPRKFVEAEATRQAAHANRLQEKGLDQTADAAAQDQDIQGKIAVAEAKGKQPNIQLLKHQSADKKWVAQQTDALREELTQLQSFKKDYSDEIPGFVAGVGWTRPVGDEINPFWGREEEEAYQRFKRPIMIRLRRESGAAIGIREEAKDSPNAGDSGGMTEKEISEQADAILGAHRTEGALLDEVDRRIDESSRRIDHYERAPEEAMVEDFNRAKSAPRAPRASGGVGLPSVISYDDEQYDEPEE